MGTRGATSRSRNGEGEIPGTARAGDPELGLVYFGTAQAKPHAPVSRGLTTADSTLYTSSTLALDVNDGHIVWYRQHAPAEALDLDTGYEQVLVDVDGVLPVLLTAGKDGVLWKLDRRDGRFLGLAEDGLSERLRRAGPGRRGAVELPGEDIHNMRIGEWLSICPSTAGGHNWHSSSYHPGTGSLVLPLSQSCMDYSARERSMTRMWMEMPGDGREFRKARGLRRGEHGRALEFRAAGPVPNSGPNDCGRARVCWGLRPLGSGPTTSRLGKCCGRVAWARPWRASRSPTRSTGSSTSPCPRAA